MVVPLSAGLKVTSMVSPVLDPIRAGGSDPRRCQDVGRAGRQLPHLGHAFRVLEFDMQRSVRIRKRELLNHAGRPLYFLQVIHPGEGMMSLEGTDC